MHLFNSDAFPEASELSEKVSESHCRRSRHPLRTTVFERTRSGRWLERAWKTTQLARNTSDSPIDMHV